MFFIHIMKSRKSTHALQMHERIERLTGGFKIPTLCILSTRGLHFVLYKRTAGISDLGPEAIPGDPRLIDDDARWEYGLLGDAGEAKTRGGSERHTCIVRTDLPTQYLVLIQ